MGYIFSSSYVMLEFDICMYHDDKIPVKQIVFMPFTVEGESQIPKNKFLNTYP